jgi:ribosome biogenesis GTPase
MRGLVLCGTNNIYTVRVDGRELECRIRGKVLRPEEKVYNPIAVGDFVAVEADPHNAADVGWITDREERRSELVRQNRKRRAPQVIAANVDTLVCITSPREPPFRPRFVDRVLVSGHAGEIEPLIFLNKADLGIGHPVAERLADYERIGYTVVRGSAKSGRGLERLRTLLRAGLTVFVGQSGVGKSSILNRLDPSLDLKVGRISRKFDRGAHTTNVASLVELAGGLRIIDTPGIRELELHDLDPQDLPHCFPEFAEAAQDCGFQPCTHTHEEDCAVKRALERGDIHADRYESYLRMLEHLEEERERAHG